MHQLQRARPTRLVVVMHNPGMKHKKEVSSTRQDLWHANQEILRQAKGVDHPLLIMEDDVEFEMPLLREKATHVEEAMREVDAYFLGCVPLLSRPLDENHMHCLLCGGAHAVVYSPQARKMLMDLPLPEWMTHDLFVSYKCRSWASKDPLAVQKHPWTENAKEWGKFCYWYFVLHKAHLDGSCFYKNHHRIGNVGGVIGMVIIACMMSFLLHRLSRSAFPSQRTSTECNSDSVSLPCSTRRDQSPLSLRHVTCPS